MSSSPDYKQHYDGPVDLPDGCGCAAVFLLVSLLVAGMLRPLCSSEFATDTMDTVDTAATGTQ